MSKFMIGVLIVVAIIGMFAGYNLALQTRPEETVRATCPPTREREWKALKQVDDKQLELSAEGVSIMTDMYEARESGDLETLKKKNQELEMVTYQIHQVGELRKEALSLLGY